MKVLIKENNNSLKKETKIDIFLNCDVDNEICEKVMESIKRSNMNIKNQGN